MEGGGCTFNFNLTDYFLISNQFLTWSHKSGGWGNSVLFFYAKFTKNLCCAKKWGVLQRFTTMIFWQVFTFGKKTSIMQLPCPWHLSIYYIFFYILQVLIYMIECISIKMISKRSLEYYPITKEDVFCYKSIYFIGSFFKVSVEEPYFYGIKLKLKSV